MQQVYQVVWNDKYNGKVYHIGMFLLQAHAVACMEKLGKNLSHSDNSFSVWQHDMFENKWNGYLSFDNELTKDLKS